MKKTFSDFFIEFQFSLVFRMVEAEEEYVEQLETLISCFLRPFKMAASGCIFPRGPTGIARRKSTILTGNIEKRSGYLCKLENMIVSL
jgi:hypothetical protein